MDTGVIAAAVAITMAGPVAAIAAGTITIAIGKRVALSPTIARVKADSSAE